MKMEQASIRPKLLQPPAGGSIMSERKLIRGNRGASANACRTLKALPDVRTSSVVIDVCVCSFCGRDIQTKGSK